MTTTHTVQLQFNSPEVRPLDLTALDSLLIPTAAPTAAPQAAPMDAVKPFVPQPQSHSAIATDDHKNGCVITAPLIDRQYAPDGSVQWGKVGYMVKDMITGETHPMTHAELHAAMDKQQ